MPIDEPEHREAGKPLRPIEMGMSVTTLVADHFHGATAGRLSSAAELLSREYLERPDLTVGLSLDAPLTPTGLSVTALVPLMQHGFLDWLTVTGTNLYYDVLLALRKPELDGAGTGPAAGAENPRFSRGERLAAEGVVREILSGPAFQKVMGSAEMHDRIGRELRQREKDLGVDYPGLLSTAHELGIPIINPSPAEGPVGSLVAELAQVGNRLSIDASLDLNLTAGILNASAGTEAARSTSSPEASPARTAGPRCAFWCLGAGVAANLMMGSPAHLARILGDPTGKAQTACHPFRLRLAGHAHMHPAGGDQPINPDAQPLDTGRDDPGTGAPPRDLAICTDLSVAVPLLTAFLLDRVPSRPLKRLGRRRDELLDGLRQAQLSSTLRRPGLG